MFQYNLRRQKIFLKGVNFETNKTNKQKVNIQIKNDRIEGLKNRREREDILRLQWQCQEEVLRMKRLKNG
jgi:hypothetical protein